MSNKPTKVLFKRNSTANTPPTADKLVPGEIALNTADGKIFLKTDAGTVIDTGKQIFERDTNVTVTDNGALDQFVITSVDGQQKLKIDAESAKLDADLVMAGGQIISLYDLANSGKVSLEAPATVPLDYTLKLPELQGTAGQIMALGEDGQMEFVAPDRFGGNRVYVSADRGDDANDGVNAPVATVKRATQIASQLVYEHKGTPAAGSVNARALLFKNKEFIKEETAAYIATNFPLFTYGTLGAIAGAEKSKRDTGLILDGAIFDMFFTGNEKSIEYGTSFYNGTATYLLANEKAICVEALQYARDIAQQIVTNTLVTMPYQMGVTQVRDSVNYGNSTNATLLGEKFDIAINILENGVNPTFTYTEGVDYDASAIVYLGSGFNAIVIEESKFTNPAAYANIVSKMTGQGWTITGSGVTTATVTQNQDWTNYFPGAKLASITPSLWQTSDWISASPINISSITYTVPAVELDTGNYRLRGVSIRIAPGNYFENNPIIVPDNVSIIGDDLRSAVIRPLNANKDIFRVRNGVYMNGFTFRDHINTAGVPDYTWRYTHAFDDVSDYEVERQDYTWIGNDKPLITQSPYIQNCSIISFLAGSGCLIDGSKVITPNRPKNQIEAENPTVGDTPEQGKSMVGNAYTMLTFGGTGWHVINDAYSQIVGCFQIFCLNGIYAQSGGYISVTNSATNFGGFALRASGYSSKSFPFDRGFISDTGTTGGAQTITVIGAQRVPLIQYVLRAFDPDTGNDVTNSFKASPTVIGFNAAAALTLGSSTFTINAHGLFTGNSIYYSRNGNPEINGLSDNGIYYVQVANVNQFNLYNDASFQYPARINAPGTGTHQLIKNPEEFYVSDILSSHTSYQKLTLASSSYEFTPGRVITGMVDIYQANAYVYSWDAGTKELIISNEFTVINGGNERVKFTSDANSFINADHAVPPNEPVGGIAIASVQDYYGLHTAVVFPKSTIEGGIISSISGLVKKRVAFHRPSIVNSSAHTWEYAGSGTDYNALPQNGGIPKQENEQYAEAPGRVYASGTNELGDFKVGNFITAENRSGLITFKSKVTVGELNVLKLTLSSIAINQISADVGLGDNEPGGASNQRLPTQKAVRSFFANRLGSVIDKSVSTNSVPGALVQLNSSGQINADLIPPQKATTTYQISTWGGRLFLSEQIPPVDVQISDQANERYDQQTLTLSGNVTATVGQVVTQLNRTGSGVVKFAVSGSNSITIANATGIFSTNAIDVISIGGVSTGEYPTNTGSIVEQSDTYYLALDNKSQFLTLANGAWSFTTSDIVTAAKNLATGIISEYRSGVLYSVDNTGLAGGTGYNPSTGSVLYYDVPLTSTSGSGTGAIADITVTSGAVSNVAVTFGGSGYAVGDTVSASATYIGGGIPSVTFTVNVNRADKRLYVDLTGNNIKFLATSSAPDYIEDNSPPTNTISDLTFYLQKSFNASATPGGNVDYSNSRINITGHGFSNGDPVVYASGVNIAIGNLTSNATYFAKRIDADTIELYLNYNLANKVTFGLSQTGTHTVSRYAVNTENFFFALPAHGYTTGTPVRVTGTTPPGGIVDNEYFFIGSVTTNAFTLHASRADALTSINGTTTNQVAITSTGAGTLDIVTQNVQINATVNTSSGNANNWNNLTATTIDASAIVSGTVSPTRLANTGSANNQTFLRGDSSWAYATASAKPATDSPVTISGDFDTRAGINYFHGDLTFDVNKVDPLEGGPNFTNFGVAAFSKSQFTVVGGAVSITAGTVDAGTLGGFTGSYYLTPANFVGVVPITKGGTNLTTYSKGDILFSSSNDTLAPLNIGVTGQVLNVDISGIPAWSDNLNLPGTLVVQNDTQSTSTTSGSIKTAGGLGVAKNTFIGGNATISGDIIGSGALSVTGVDKNISLQPTGTGTVTINPSTKGAIDNIDIGTTTRGSAKVTTLAASGDTVITSNTASTNATSGALVVTGGVGIGGDAHITGNTVIGGDLTVSGTTFTVNSTVTTIEDPIIDIGGGTSGAAPTTNDNKDRGIKFQWHNGTVAKTGFFGYKNADGYFEFIPDATITSEVATGTLGDIKAGTFRGALVSGNATISGGSIYGTPVGAANASTGAFTTLTANGATTLTAGTVSVDTTTGTLVVTGGVGISGALNSGSVGTGAITASGNVTFSGSNATITLSPTGTGSVIISPATVGTIDKVNIGATTAGTGRFTTLTATTSVTLTPSGVVTINPSTTGALDNVNIGTNTRGTGAFTTLTANDSVTLTGNVASTNTTSGTLVITGGTGISGNLNVGGTIGAGSSTFTHVTDSSLTTGRVVLVGVSSQLADNTNLTFNVGSSTLTTTNISATKVTGGDVYSSALTAGRITFAGTSGILSDSSGLTYNSNSNTLTGSSISAGTLVATTSANLSPTGTVTINPGTISNIDNVNIGVNTSGTGKFTTLTATGITSVTDATQSSATNNGSIVTSGGVGIAKNLYVGGNANITGTAVVTSTLTAQAAVSFNPNNNNISLAPTGTGTVTINPATTGAIDNVIVGATTARAAYFTSVSATGVLSFTNTTESSGTSSGALILSGGAGIAKNLYVGGNINVTGTATVSSTLNANGIVNLNPANNSVSIQPTGTGSVTINPTVVGAIDNMVIGANTAKAATFTALTTSGNVSLAGAGSLINLSPTGSGYVTINPSTSGSIDNMSIGQTTAKAGTFTAFTATTSASLSPTGSVTINPGTTSSVDNVNIGANTRGTAAFTTLAASGAVTLTDVTQSTNTTSGAITTAGGLGVAKNANIGGNLIVSGNLTINGTTTTVNSVVSTVEDPIMDIGGGAGGIAPTSDDSKDRGITFQYFDTSAKRGFFGFDNQTGRFKYIEDATLTGEVATGTLGDIEATTFYGNVVGSSATFTTITADSVGYNDTTDSTSIITGSITTAGGVGIAKRINVGGEAQFGLNNLNYVTVNGAQAGDAVTIGSLGGDTAVSILIVPQGNGLVGITSTSALTIPVGDNAARPANAPDGSIRFNNETTQFEGYNGVGWSSLGGVKSVDGLTYIVPELTAGSSDDTLYFVAGGEPAGEWNADRLTINSKGFRVPTGADVERPSFPVAGDFRFNTDTVQFEGYSGVNWSTFGGVRSQDGLTYITAESSPGASDDTLFFYADGSIRATVSTTGLQVDNINLYGRQIKATDTNGSLELSGTGTGIVKVLGTGAFKIPAGTTAEAVPGSPGYIRYNTDTRALEVWDQFNGIYKPVGSGGSSSDEAGDTKITYETNGNDEKTIRFYVGAGQPNQITQGSVEIANISKQGFLVSDKINIYNNVIENITPDEDLIIRANGTGRVVIDGSGAGEGGGNVFATDPLLTLNSAFTTGTNTYDSGFVVRRGSADNTSFIWSEVGGEFRAVTTTDNGTTRGTLSQTGYADIASASVKLNSETADKLAFLDSDKIVRSLDTGRTTYVDGKLVFNTASQLVIPVGTTEQRQVAPDTGSIRFNTTAELFEGYASGGWQAMGVGYGSAPTYEGFIANGTDSTITLTTTPLSAAGIIVVVDNQVLEPEYDYTVSGNDVQFINNGSGALVLPAGTRIDVRHVSKPSISSIREFSYVGDGLNQIFETDYPIATKAEVMIFVNSIRQDPTKYEISGKQVTLITAPGFEVPVALIHFCTIIAPDVATRAEAQDDAIAFAIALG